MPFSPELIVYGLIFVGVFVLVEGVYLTVFGKSISLNRESYICVAVPNDVACNSRIGPRVKSVDISGAM